MPTWMSSPNGRVGTARYKDINCGNHAASPRSMQAALPQVYSWDSRERHRFLDFNRFKISRGEWASDRQQSRFRFDG